MKSRIFMLFLALAIVFIAAAREYGVRNIPNVQLVDSLQLLSDPDSIIDDASAREIDSLLLDIRRRSSVEMAVVVVGDFQGSDIDEFVTSLFKFWGLGKKGNDSGVLLLVARDRHKVTIRTGYGVEGLLPDIVCGHLIRDLVVPEFKADRYGAGVLAAVSEIHRIATDPTAAAELQERLKKDRDDGDGWMYVLLFFGIIGLLVWALMKFSNKGGGSGDGTSGRPRKTITRTASPRSPSRNSSGGSRGGHFGGGSTGGGGATGSW